MSKIAIVFIGLLLFSLTSISQVLKKQTLSSQGSSHLVYANNRSYFIQESIGQASVIRTYDANNHSLRQGFLQPLSPSSLIGEADGDLDGIVFPNPFQNIVTVRFNEIVIDEIYVQLFDMLGRVIYDQIHQPNQTLNLRFENIRTGNYLIRIQMRSKVLVSKLIKR